MDKPNLSNIERGKRFMTAETLEKIATALNTTERELFDFSESIPQKYFRADIEKILDNSVTVDDYLKKMYKFIDEYHNRQEMKNVNTDDLLKMFVEVK